MSYILAYWRCFELNLMAVEHRGGIINDYKQRWRIETMFGNLKKRGFRFEDTHLKDPNLMSKLLALLALAFCYALQIGVFRITQGQHITFKQSLNRPLKYFSTGF